MTATHRATLYGVPCYMNMETGEVRGTCWLADVLLPVAAWIHNAFAFLIPGAGAEGFPFMVREEYSPPKEV